jgi:hypothetical protein
MQRVSLKAGLATAWVSVVLLAGIVGNLDMLSTWPVLVGVAFLPPVVMMWRWNDPGQTVSQSIQEARR